MTIRKYFLRLHKLSVLGRVFPIPEENCTDSPLSYIPIVACVNLELKSRKDRLRYESPYHLRVLPSHLLDSQLDNDFLDLPFSCVDLSNTFLGISWLYLFNLRERMRDYRAPNILTYINFTSEMRAQCLGL
jgi:hypothetical protein